MTDSVWRRNLAILFSVQLLSTAGFSLIFPFLPLYVREVGIATHGSLEFWAALVFSSQALTMALSAPIWGALADRLGRKMMIARATLGGAVILVLMGFVHNAEQLVLLRTVQGAVTGVAAAVTALAAAQTPPGRSGGSLGLLQTGRWIGVGVGPLIGGVMGDAFGFRESFWITGALLGLAGLAAVFGLQEDFTPQPPEEQVSMWADYRALFTAPGMTGLYSLTFLQSLGRTIITPFAALFVVQLMGTEVGAASMTGLIVGSAAITGAFSGVWLGRLGDRIGHTPVLIGAASFALAASLPQPFVTAAWQLVVLQMLSGFAVGGITPALAALMNLWTPSGHQGATYGLENSINAAARMVAPMAGAGIAVWLGLRGVFVGAVVIYGMIVLLALSVARSAQRAHRAGSRQVKVRV
ncbi:MAG: MFS transporter [Caldilineaceae bacterium]|nr:MFS transporter [Caldilineaceae bacterium]